MKRTLSCFCFFLFSLLLFSQQNEDFREVKSFYDQHEVRVNGEFKRRLALVKNFEEKVKLEGEYNYFISKLDSARNQAYLGALIKTKNLEQLAKLSKGNEIVKNEKVTEKEPDHIAVYPGGEDKLRETVSSSFYFNGTVDHNSTLKSIVSFIVEKDGSIAYVNSEGDNVIFNRQAEISLYLVPDKFIPGQLHGKPVRSRFQFPITMKFD
ncbi:energy transducer TonB [Elizabethkingia meningoseptica]|uniref:energy transducer TonB n=1 Tax=Elizabethkingia meningoseptica TaxID=238 RepID=UPI0038925A43